MKMTHSEAMKYLKSITYEIDELMGDEKETCVVRYYDSDKEIIKTNYDYSNYSKRLSTLYKEERKVKRALALSNATTVVKRFNMTIAECLVYMGQLNHNIGRLEYLASKSKKVRSSTYSTVETVEILYDKDEVKKELKKMREELSQLQMAIDLANLTTVIEF